MSPLVLVRGFLDRKDFSLAAARLLEGQLDEVLQRESSAVVESLRDVLASYRPGGGEFLFDESYLHHALETACRLLGDSLPPPEGSEAS